MIELRYPVTHEKRLYLAEIEAFIVEYRPLVDAAWKLRDARAMAVDAKKTAVSDLIHYVRDFLEVLERRNRHEKLPEGLLVYYNQERIGDNPTGNRERDWLGYTSDIVNGEAGVVAKGYPPMVNPSAAEVGIRCGHRGRPRCRRSS